jgi:hypothetical protein
MTSMQRGMLPAGISSAFSWTRSVCQSTKVDWSGRSWNSLEEHWLFLQIGGCENWHCCSTNSWIAPHFAQLKVARMSSGRTSEERVTVPVMATSRPETSQEGGEGGEGTNSISVNLSN